MVSRFLATGLASLMLVAACGCGGSQGETAAVVAKVTPMSGKLVFADGKPVNHAWLVFHPKDPPANESTAATQADGSFKVGTFAKEDGIIPGRYVVTVQPHPNVKSGAPSIPSAYTSPKTSPLKIEVNDSTKDLGTLKIN
jgi:hypothetical protein